MNTIEKMFFIPEPSTNAIEESWYCKKNGNVYLHIKCVSNSDDIISTSIIFRKVRAVRSRAEGHCNSWHLLAYDSVIAISDSEWVGQIREDNKEWYKSFGNKFTMNHYMIYLDSFGCLEVISDSVEHIDEVNRD